MIQKGHESIIILWILESANRNHERHVFLMVSFGVSSECCFFITVKNENRINAAMNSDHVMVDANLPAIIIKLYISAFLVAK